MKFLFVTVAALLLAAGCASNSGNSTDSRERGRDGTVAYLVKIESSEPGARVEVDNDYVGNTPIEIKIFGDKDGTFHNFGSSDFVIRVFPVREGQHVQTKTFRTGGWFSQEDRVPSRLFFDLNQPGGDSGGEPPKPRY